MRSLSAANDRIRLNAWLPPHDGVGIGLCDPMDQCLVSHTARPVSPDPRSRVTEQLCTMPGVQELVVRYPR